ncbi:MAG: hypothetical protein NW226_25475 [Microscillaceae bacterium]|nr:hypothetical protein [Microscillaceae bacterium]
MVYLKRQHKKAPLYLFIIPAFCWKILAGIAYGWVYVVYYGGVGDSLNFFQDGAILAKIAVQNPRDYFEIVFFNIYHPIPGFATGDLWIQPRAFIFVKLISFLNLITGNNYWLIGFYFSLFSFWGMWSLANTLSSFYPSSRNAAVLAFLFLPSVVFFSAGLNKESLVMGGLGLSLSRFLVCLLSSPQSNLQWINHTVIWLFTILLLWLVKFYYLAALLPIVLAYALTLTSLQKIHILATFFKAISLKILFFLFILIVFTLMGMYFVPSLDLESLMINIVSNHNITYIFSMPEDLIHYTIIYSKGYITLSPTWISFVYNTPQALFSALFRPFLWETGGNKLKMLIALENFCILFLCVFASIILVKRLASGKKIRTQEFLLIFATLLYISILYTLLAFSSPNFGSLIRYKIAAAPFLIYLISIDFLNYAEELFFRILKRRRIKII